MKLRLTQIDYETRVKLGAMLLLVLTTLLTNLSFLRYTLSKPSDGTEQEVRISDQRFTPVANKLAGHRMIGYIDEHTSEHEIQNPPDKSGAGWWTNPGVKKYYLTQFSLAPVILVRGAEPPLVVSNYDNEFNANARPQQLVPVGNFGGGIILFEKKTK